MICHVWAPKKPINTFPLQCVNENLNSFCVSRDDVVAKAFILYVMNASNN